MNLQSSPEKFPGEGIKRPRGRGIATAFLEKNPRVDIFIFHRLNGTIGRKLNSSPGNRARRQISFPVSRAYPIRFVSAITTVSSFLFGDVARGVRGNEGAATRLENDSILAVDGATRWDRPFFSFFFRASSPSVLNSRDSRDYDTVRQVHRVLPDRSSPRRHASCIGVNWTTVRNYWTS